jgi:hypothetical protein
MRIEYAITRNDEFDGNPVLLGIVTDDVFWARVKDLPDGHTLWRRLFVTSSPVVDWRTASGN